MNRSLKTLLILLFSIPQFSQAQNAIIQLGIEGGLNRTQFFSDNKPSSSLYNTSYSENTGPSAGVSFQVNTKRFFSFKTGISFDRKSTITKISSKNNPIGSTSQSRFVYTSDYVSLPVLGKLTFGKKVQLFLNAGVYFAFLADQNRFTEGSSTVLVDGQNHYNEFSFNESIDFYKRFDFGLIGGLGLGVPIKKHWYISLEAREVIGLTYLYNTTKYKTPPMSRNATIHMLLGVAYKIGFYKEK